MPQYTYTNLISAIVADSSTISNIQAIANRAVKDVVAEIDLRSTKRSAAISPQIYQEVFNYGAPADIKEEGIIDVQPQINRSSDSELELVSVEEFDRTKDSVNNLVAISDADFIKILKLSMPVNSNELVVNECDSLTGDGTFAASGSASNITLDQNNYVNGSASINFDVAANFTSAIISVTGMDAADLTDYEGHELFVWLYVPAIDGLTSVKLRWGNDASNYYEATATTNNEGLSWYVGWNLVRFSWPASATGTVDLTAVDYLRLELIGDGSCSASTDWRLDFVVARVGVIYNVLYYSKYGWQTSAGVYIIDSTAAGDKLNADAEEFDLFVLKGKQILFEDQFLYADADYFKTRYEEKRLKYLEKYPSERKTMISNYRTFSTVEE